MKKLMLLILIGCICFATADAQVKRQFRDADYAATTVVIKEEQGMSDIDILNAQFDLADVSMGDVIRITTEKDRPVVIQSTSKPTTEVPTTAEIPQDQEPIVQKKQEEIALPEAPITATLVVEEVIEEEAPVVEEVAVAQEQEVQAIPVINNIPAQRAQQTNQGQATRGSSSNAGSKSSSYKKKKRKKKIYLKKRRKVKRKRYNKCYAF